MPPKKKDAVPQTPGGDSPDAQDSAPPSTTKKRAPRKPKAPEVPFKKLPALMGTILVDVTYENESVHSKALDKGMGFGHTLKLIAPQPFELVGSYILEDGHQVIMLKPAKPFPFLKLPKEIRHEILGLILDPGSELKGRIDISTDKNNAVKAKDYVKDIKNRLGIMGVNKELNAEGRSILYNYKLRFDTTSTLLNFLTTAGDQVRHSLTSLSISGYTKATAMPALTMLADCKNLTNLRILNGVGVNSAPQKAAKAFFADSGRLLSALANKLGDKEAAVNSITFGMKKCFTVKEEDEIRSWDEDELEEFKEALKSKINQVPPATVSRWTCICGSTQSGHVCSQVMDSRAMPPPPLPALTTLSTSSQREDDLPIRSHRKDTPEYASSSSPESPTPSDNLSHQQPISQQKALRQSTSTSQKQHQSKNTSAVRKSPVNLLPTKITKPVKKSEKREIACMACRSRKTKCEKDGGVKCMACRKRGVRCVYR